MNSIKAVRVEIINIYAMMHRIKEGLQQADLENMLSTNKGVLELRDKLTEIEDRLHKLVQSTYYLN